MRANYLRSAIRITLPLRQTILLLVGAIMGGASTSAQAGDTPTRFEFSEVHMGMPVKVALYTASEQAANLAAKAVYARFYELNKLLSDYDPDSALCKLSRSAPHESPVAVSQDLWVVLERSHQLTEASAGAFDVTAGPLIRLWRRARRNGEMPSAERLAEARAAVGADGMRLDRAARTVQLLRAKMQLDLGGIAVGYAVDEGLKVLREQGIQSAMIDASGDIGVSNPPPGASGWRIGLVPLPPDAPPSGYLLLANAAVTTSGDAYQFVEIDGKRYSHIVDPRTGDALTDRTAVTIVAPDCMTADSLATAVSVLGPEAGMALVERQAEVAGMILREVDGKPVTVESSRWRKLPLELVE